MTLTALVFTAAAIAQTPGPSVAGARLDTSPFEYAREIAAGDAAFVSVRLDAAVLAHSAGPDGRFADLRIVDGSNRQIPWLIEPGAEPFPIAVTFEQASTRAPELRDTPERRQSVYRIALPYPRLSGAALVVRTDARVFRRPVQLGYERPADRRHRDAWFEPFATTLWEHADPASAAPPLSLTLQPSDQSDVTMVIEDGDNSALPIAAVQLRLPTYRLRFFRPASTPLRLLYGDDRAAPPSYDLALLAPSVLGAAAVDASLGPETGGPPRAGNRLVTPRVFWALIALAVVALLAILASLVRRSSGQASE